MLPVRIVTYNLRMNTPNDGENSFDNRKGLIRQKLLGEKPMPDIFCFQEALPDMLQWLRDTLGEQYASVGLTEWRITAMKQIRSSSGKIVSACTDLSRSGCRPRRMSWEAVSRSRASVRAFVSARS